MNKPLRFILIAACFLLLALVLFCSCNALSNDLELSIDTPPETTAEIIPTGTFYVRCSEPEANQISVQFIGALPSCYVDYVGLEANKLYTDGTRGPIDTAKITVLHDEITDTDRGVTITPQNFGLEDGYLFQRLLTRIPTNIPDLAYEVAAYYVIGTEKIYLAKQTFYVDVLLYEHILANPKPFTVVEESSIIDVQKWNKFQMDETFKPEIDGEENVKLSNIYYLGTAAPDAHGNVKMYLCYAIPSTNNTTVGIRYRFTETEGEYAGIQTQTRRERTNILYKSVITETETLTPQSFELDDAYLALISFTDDLNTVLCETYDMEIVAYYSRNAVEQTVISATHNFTELVQNCVLTYYSIDTATYTYRPLDYSNWADFSAANGNASGEGLFKVRVSKAENEKFAMQIASAVPSRFLERAIFIFSAYDESGEPIYIKDKNQNEIPLENQETSITTLYPSIFGNTDDFTAKDFGIDRGYIISMLLNNIELDGETTTLKIEAYYFINLANGEEHTSEVSESFLVASLTFSIEELSALVESVE